MLVSFCPLLHVGAAHMNRYSSLFVAHPRVHVSWVRNLRCRIVRTWHWPSSIIHSVYISILQRLYIKAAAETAPTVVNEFDSSEMSDVMSRIFVKVTKINYSSYASAPITPPQRALGTCHQRRP